MIAESIRNAMSDRGIPYSGIIYPTDKIVRIKLDDERPGKKSGWYLFYDDPNYPVVVFGDWRQSDKGIVWTPKNDKEMDEAERRAYRERIEKAKLEQQQEQARLAEEAKDKANLIWNQAQPVNGTGHPYLDRKKANAFGIRVDSCNRLIIPAYDIQGNIHTIQWINAEAEKRFLAHGAKVGHFFTIEGKADKIHICEGYATGATIHEATGSIVIIAFDAGNLEPVAQQIRKKYPDKKIILCADNDAFKPDKGNRGVESARNAADAIGARLVIPFFRDTSTEPTDFNDLFILEGMDEVIRQLSKYDTWPEPILFGEIETPDIPIDVLPDGWLKDFTGAVAASTQTPPGMAVMFALSTVAACLQKRFEVSPYGDNYTEPLNLWTLTALDPANRKTAVKNELTAPLTTWEHEENKRLQSEIKRINTERDINLKSIDQLKVLAAKPQTTDEERKNYLKRISEIEEKTPEEIRPPRIWADDTTPERFQMLLVENSEQISVISDEGGIFEVMAGLYSDGRMNINVFLQSHSGSSVRVERQGRHVALNAPVSTFGLAVQPEILADMSRGSKKKFRGLGVLTRFLYCIPKSTVGSRDIRRRGVISEMIKSNYHSKIFSLLNINSIHDESGMETPLTLTLSKEALESWEYFSQYIESKLGVNGEYYQIQDWCGKLPGAALRIAGNLHVVEHGENNRVIGKETIERALDLCELLIPHVQAAFDLMGADEAVSDSKHVFKWIIDTREETFSQRDCLKRFEGRFKRVDRLRKALEVLAERHIISEPQKRTTSGRPGIFYMVNPSISEGVK